MGSLDLLSHLSARDKELFWKFGIGEKVDIPFQCVHHGFEHHARANPNLTAVEEFELKLTYGELERKANCFAARLRGAGVHAGSRVCLLVERSLYLLIGCMGILKAGGAYAPLDGNVVSDSTLKHAIKDSEPVIILTLRKFQHRVAGFATEVVYLDEALCSSYDPDHCIKPQDFASSANSCYIIYTSGTTGTPKGVDVTHGNVVNLLCTEPGKLGMKPGVKVAQMMNISFDMAAWEFLGALVNGATLCLRGKNSKEWKQCLRTVDVLVNTHSMLAPHNPADYPNIKTVAIAGEPCSKSTADLWGAHVNFWNCCGPTEVTIVNTMQLHKPGDTVAIGAPIPNTTLYILDEDLRPVPIGEPGVMWAGGACVSNGYLNLPDKTSERYIRDPFMNDGSLMFNTGDLGRWDSRGSPIHLGRVDNQVKIKGFRVELDGVALAMETCPGVLTATALLIEGELWGFFTPSHIDTEEIKEAALKIQPYYAVPTKFMAFEEFPKTANGKTDKKILRQMALDSLMAPSVVSKPTDRAHSNWASLPTVNIQPNGALTIPTVDVQANNPSNLPTVDIQPNGTLTLPTIASEESLSETTIAGSQRTPIESSTSIDKVEKQEPQEPIWAGYTQDEPVPQTNGWLIRNLRHQAFSLYRRLFSVVFLINIGVLAWVMAEKRYDASRLGGIVVANVFLGVLMRQELVVNAFFIVFTSIPASWPLFIRRTAARVYHIGGLHSAAGVSAFIWLIAFTVQATKEVINKGKTSAATLAVTYVILLLIQGMLIFAYPAMRRRFHDVFENTHRYFGWTALALVWAQYMLLTKDYLPEGQTLSYALVRSPQFYLIIILTCSIIWPWCWLRKVEVKSEVLSNHAVRLWFDYGVTPGAGSFVRLSDSPLKDWHGFATIPMPGRTGYSLVVSRAGDWTADHIANPRKKIWVRGIPTYGVLKIVPLFRRMVLIATGSGIGPCASAIFEKKIAMRVLWTAPDVRGTFGNTLVDSILEANPDAVIYDTRKHGKPDMVKLTLRLVKEFDAEAVAIISNQSLTEKVVYAMQSRGIPAFGAIFDS